MINKNLKVNRFFCIGVIIIVSFVYTINIQPVVFGSDTNYFQIDEKNQFKNVISFRLYIESLSFFKIFPSSIHYNNTLPSNVLETNKETGKDFFTYFYGGYTGFILHLKKVYIYNFLFKNELELTCKNQNWDFEETNHG